MRRLLFVVGAAAVLGYGCSAPTASSGPRDQRSAASATALPVNRLRAEPYSFAYYSGMADSARVTVRDAGAWRQAWSAVWRGSSPVPALPQIDFGQEMVVVVALGTRNSGGYSILVDSAYQYGDRVEVVVRKESPGSRCFTTAALTQPVDIARIPASTLPVRFRERSFVHDCT
ncbi:MAG TPA: protease complex subunit PrcB family protein [Longimicrobium sp.]